jgi:hypothetical protein
MKQDKRSETPNPDPFVNQASGLFRSGKKAVIHRFDLNGGHLQETTLSLPTDAKIISFGANAKDKGISVWVMFPHVADTKAFKPRVFTMIATGEQFMPDTTGHPDADNFRLTYRDTVITPAQEVWHIFEREETSPCIN